MTRPGKSTASAKAKDVESIRNRRWIEGFVGAAYLEKLNIEQGLVVEHGTGLLPPTIGGPLLVIAGAGSGKTNTLAHRVAT